MIVLDPAVLITNTLTIFKLLRHLKINILKNNQLKDVLKHFDLIRTQENLQSIFIDSKDLSKLPVYWLNESVNTLHQNEQLVYLQKRMIELSKKKINLWLKNSTCSLY